jgi:phosphoribosylanthranilate isomerase
VIRTRVKICGITRQSDALAAIAAGADAIGLVFYAGSKRAVDIDSAKDILAGLPPMVTVTALFVDAVADEVEQVCRELPINLLQFHGKETCDYCGGFGLPYMKALRVSDGVGLTESIAEYADASAILLDTFHPTIAGGTGERFDWSLMPVGLSASLVLAGGLDASNVGAAVKQVRPYSVDVSGGVEERAGIKSAELMQKFVQAVRSADLSASGS